MLRVADRLESDVGFFLQEKQAHDRGKADHEDMLGAAAIWQIFKLRLVDDRNDRGMVKRSPPLYLSDWKALKQIL